MKKLVFSVLLLALLIPNLAFSQENKELVGYYDSEFFQFNFSMFGGLQVTYRGQTSSTQFGIPENFARTLSMYPDSKEYIDSFKKLNKTGNILLWGGLGAALLSSAYVTILDPYDPNWDMKFNVAFGVAIGGFISTMVGAFIYPASFEKLCLSINTYNRHRLSEY